MNYAFRYYNDINYDYANLKEIIIKYTEKDPTLINFVKNSKLKVVADVTECKNLEDSENIFQACLSAMKKFTLKIGIAQKDIIPFLMENNISFFFAEGADTWDKLESYILSGASEVYIINELGFDIIRVSDTCKKYSVKIRMYPNVAQTSAILKDELDTSRFFYVIPEDSMLYNEYVDIFEFFGPVDRQNVLYKIYEEDKEWIDDLSLVIIGLKEHVISASINPALGGRRLSCRKKCVASECIACFNAFSMAGNLAKMKLYFKGMDNEKSS